MSHLLTFLPITVESWPAGRSASARSFQELLSIVSRIEGDASEV